MQFNHFSINETFRAAEGAGGYNRKWIYLDERLRSGKQ